MDNNQLQELVSTVQRDGITDYYGNQWHVYHTIPVLSIITVVILLFYCFYKYKNDINEFLVGILGAIVLTITVITSVIILNNRSKYYNKMTNPENYIYRLVTFDRN